MWEPGAIKVVTNLPSLIVKTTSSHKTKWFYGWESLMVSHYKFGGNRHCSSGHMMFLVVEGKYSACYCFKRHSYLSLKHRTYLAHTHEISGRKLNKLAGVPNEALPILVTHIKKNNWWKLPKKLLPVRSEKAMRRKRMAFAKLFALLTNIIRCSSSVRFNLFELHFHLFGVKMRQIWPKVRVLQKMFLSVTA